METAMSAASTTRPRRKTIAVSKLQPQKKITKENSDSCFKGFNKSDIAKTSSHWKILKLKFEKERETKNLVQEFQRKVNAVDAISEIQHAIDNKELDTKPAMTAVIKILLNGKKMTEVLKKIQRKNGKTLTEISEMIIFGKGLRNSDSFNLSKAFTWRNKNFTLSTGNSIDQQKNGSLKQRLRRKTATYGMKKCK